jgi:hypothetical protein
MGSSRESEYRRLSRRNFMPLANRFKQRKEIGKKIECAAEKLFLRSVWL